MNWNTLVDPAVSGRLCLTLLHSVWQVALLAVVAWGVGRFWKRRSVESRYVANVTALLAAFVAMPITFVLLDDNKQTGTPVIDNPVAVDVAESEPITVVATPPFAEMITPEPMTKIELRPNSSEPAEFIATGPPPVVQVAEEPSPGWLQLAPWIVAFYTTGVVLMLVRLMVAVLKQNRLGTRAQPITNGPLLETLQRLAHTWSMRVVPTLARAEQIAVPIVIGIVRPTILLPTSAISGLTTDELEMILTHELAHVRRHDMWVNLLQRVAEAVLFFNPALWYLSRRISTLREYCCDEMTCRAQPSADLEPRIRYATALLRVVELARPNAIPTNDLAALAASGQSISQLRRRVSRLLGEPLREPLRISRGGIFVVAATVLMLFAGPVVWEARTQSHGEEKQVGQSTPETSTAKEVNSETARDGKATLSGRIVMEGGSPAKVKGWMFYNSRRENRGHYGTDNQYTDSFSCVAPAGTIWLSYFPDGYAPAWAGPFDLKAGEEQSDLTIVLKRGFSELIQVINEKGEPVAGATLQFYPEINGSAGGPHREHTTDAQGEFLLEHLADTRYALTIAAPGYQTLRTEPLKVEPGKVLRPTMIRSQPTTGVVRNADGSPAVGAKLRATAEFLMPSPNHTEGVSFADDGEGFWGKVFATTDAQGRFKMDQLTSGKRYFFNVKTQRGAQAIIKDLQAGQQDVEIVVPKRRDLVVKIKGDMNQLYLRNERPFIRVSLPVYHEFPSGFTYSNSIGADVQIFSLNGEGAQATFRGLPVDLNPGAEKQQVEVTLGNDRKTTKTVDVNLTGDTVVELELELPVPSVVRAREAILESTNHKQAAFNVVPSMLSELSANDAWAVVQNVWPKISSDEVKTGVLKAFAFARHPHVLDVLDLGATDDSVKVKEYAYSYLTNYALRDFKDPKHDYAAWRRQYGRKEIESLLEANCRWLVEDLRNRQPADNLAWLISFEAMLNLEGNKSTYPNKAKYLRGAGLIDILKSWQDDPRAGKYVKRTAKNVIVKLEKRRLNKSESHQGADLRGQSFVGMILDKGVDRLLENADLRECDLSGVTFVGGFKSFYKCNFSAANLTDSIFTGQAAFQAAHFYQATLTNAVLRGGGSSFQSTSFKGSDLTGARLQGTGPAFQKATFDDANLFQATIQCNGGSAFQSVSLNNTNFSDAVLESIDRRSLDSCVFNAKTPPKYSSKTRFPDGFDPLSRGWKRVAVNGED